MQEAHKTTARPNGIRNPMQSARPERRSNPIIVSEAIPTQKPNAPERAILERKPDYDSVSSPRANQL